MSTDDTPAVLRVEHWSSIKIARTWQLPSEDTQLIYPHPITLVPPMFKRRPEDLFDTKLLPPLPAIKDTNLKWGMKRLARGSPRPNVHELAYEGDSVIGLAATLAVGASSAGGSNHIMTTTKSLLVCNTTLSHLCLAYRLLAPYPPHKQKIYADVFEAHIGALYREAKRAGQQSRVEDWLAALYSPTIWQALRNPTSPHRQSKKTARLHVPDAPTQLALPLEPRGPEFWPLSMASTNSAMGRLGPRALTKDTRPALSPVEIAQATGCPPHPIPHPRGTSTLPTIRHRQEQSPSTPQRRPAHCNQRIIDLTKDDDDFQNSRSTLHVKIGVIDLTRDDDELETLDDHNPTMLQGTPAAKSATPNSRTKTPRKSSKSPKRLMSRPNIGHSSTIVAKCESSPVKAGLPLRNRSKDIKPIHSTPSPAKRAAGSLANAKRQPKVRSAAEAAHRLALRAEKAVRADVTTPRKTVESHRMNMASNSEVPMSGSLCWPDLK